MKHGSSAQPSRGASAEMTSAARTLLSAREHERAGRRDAAVAAYRDVIVRAEEAGELRVLAEALRLLSILLPRGDSGSDAHALCERSFGIASEIGDELLAAQALNTIGAFELEAGRTASARDAFERALERRAASPALEGRIEQNLGITANIRGDLQGALAHYHRSLAAFQRAGDDSGCAIAYHNLGMISADRGQWNAAEGYFGRSLELANELGDTRLRGLCLLNRTEVLLACQRYEDARASAETALRLFDELGAQPLKAEAYKFLGILYRETGRPMLAQARLEGAIALAASSGALLAEAEASRERAPLVRQLGRNQDALRLLNASHHLFVRLDAEGDQGDVAAKMAALENVYLAIVREWGQSIESADSYTHGHCERVATYAVAVARALGLAPDELTTVRIGAYLHDVGKVRIPHEILNKPGRLTSEERELMELHPVYGLELLAGIEFPWDIRPIIRWHHEKLDGTGYPDHLSGDQIPLVAHIVGIADVYDALTSTRSYRAALSADVALAEMHRCRHWWPDDVFDAFLRSVAGEAAADAA
jgi:putative nucleotidyltransferase with HDIG domain